MADKDKPSNQSRRKFLKEVSAGIVTVYAVPPAVKANAKTLQKEISDTIAGKVDLKLTVNKMQVSLKIDPSKTLAELLRDDLNLMGTKLVCNQGECGSCTVLINNKAVYSCHILALDADGAEVITIEGLLNGDELNELQQAFVDEDGLQCGFCTPGQIMSGYAILKSNPNATNQEIKKGMSGNLCRCGAYPKIFDSVTTVLARKK